MNAIKNVLCAQPPVFTFFIITTIYCNDSSFYFWDNKYLKNN